MLLFHRGKFKFNKHLSFFQLVGTFLLYLKSWSGLGSNSHCLVMVLIFMLSILDNLLHGAILDTL